jgi:hypothetical protein
LAQVKGPVRDVFIRSGFLDELGAENVFLSVHDAMTGLDAPQYQATPELAQLSAAS